LLKLLLVSHGRPVLISGKKNVFMNSSMLCLKSTTHVEILRSGLRKWQKRMELHLKKSMPLAVIEKSTEAT